VKAISSFVLGLAISCASAAATAQDLTAGKTPAQLFRSDCAECHRSPGSVAGTRDVHELAAFLREHYTSKSETAGALAAYVSSFAGTGAAVRNRGSGVAAPASGEPPPARRRNRGEGDATAAAAGSNASPIEDTPPRRRGSGISGDVETKRAHNDRDAPRPPGVIAATPASAKSNARTRKGEPRDARAPVLRLRSESANVEAGKTAGPRARKRRNATGDVVPPAAGVPAQTKANDVLTAPDPVPGQGNVSPPAASPLP
jgi:mono/diheme cytochrome c family protein